MKTCLKIFAAILIFAMLPFGAFATTSTTDADEIIYLEDGSYITVELTETATRASGTKTASKSYTYRSSSGDEQWKAVIRGTFTYTGTSATCTAASCDVTISNSVWSIKSKSASPSGNTAVANLTMIRKFLGITIDTESITMRITCDANGNLS